MMSLKSLLSAGLTGTYRNHKLIWTLFADRPDTPRPFIYDVIAQSPFTAIIRSSVPPKNDLGCWKIDTVPFSPVHAIGTRLKFRTKVVATKSPNPGGAKRGKPVDAVLWEWESIEPVERREKVMPADVAHSAAVGWLQQQQERCGFALDGKSVMVMGYERDKIVKGKFGNKSEQVTLGVLDLGGFLEVTDSSAFANLLVNGFGKGKCFGYGLVHVAAA
jgi:CRISPR system Cascade subunit CasE